MDALDHAARIVADPHTTLRDFALWLHPTWDAENEDDVAAATDAVNRFLTSAPRVSEASIGAEGELLSGGFSDSAATGSVEVGADER